MTLYTSKVVAQWLCLTERRAVSYTHLIHTIHLGALTVYEPRKQLRFSKEWEEKI